MKTLFLFTISFAFHFYSFYSFAQSGSTLMGARQTGMGYASSVTADEWAIWNNVGGLGKIKEQQVSAAYEVTPALVGANRMAFAGALPTRWGTCGIGAFRFGDQIYSEQVVSLGFGNQLGITSLGAKANVVQYRAEGFGVRTAISFDFGGITRLTQQLTIGAYITNLTQSTFLGADNYRLPTKLTAGLGIRPNDNVLIVTEIEKDLDYKPTWRSGLEYQALKNFFVRTGFNFNPQAAYAGLGAVRSSVKFDYAIRFNQLLGTSHQASVVWVIKRVKKE